jgi:hypothetical protein
MRIAPIIRRLEALDLFRSVRGARHLSMLGNSGLLPQCYVVPESEQASENGAYAAGHHQQRLDQIYAVLIVVGAAAAAEVAQEDELHQLVDGVMAALAGWVHPDSRRHDGDAGSPMDFLSGRMLPGPASGQLHWLLRLRSRAYLRRS